MCGAAAGDLINYIDGIAAPHEKLCPSLAAIGRAGEVRAGLAAAMHHHDGIGLAAMCRDHVLDIHVAQHGTAFCRRIDPAAHEEIARLRQRERSTVLGVSGRLAQRPCRDREPKQERLSFQQNWVHAFAPCDGSVSLRACCSLRQSLGLVMPSLTRDIAISVSEFTLALSLQNLAWGALQPFAGALVVRAGFRPVMLSGAALY